MGFLLRVFLIGFVIYLIIGLAFGGYSRIKATYYWMRPTPQRITHENPPSEAGPMQVIHCRELNQRSLPVATS